LRTSGRVIDLRNRTAWDRCPEKNPSGKVPVLDDVFGFALHESGVIMEYPRKRKGALLRDSVAPWPSQPQRAEGRDCHGLPLDGNYSETTYYAFRRGDENEGSRRAMRRFRVFGDRPLVMSPSAVGDRVPRNTPPEVPGGAARDVAGRACERPSDCCRNRRGWARTRRGDIRHRGRWSSRLGRGGT